MNIFILAGCLPSPNHSVRASNRVLWGLVSELHSQGNQTILQIIYSSEDRRSWTSREHTNIKELSTLGVTLLPPFFRSDYITSASEGVSRLFLRSYVPFLKSLEFFYPAARLRPDIQERIRESGADVVLVFWSSDGLAATYGTHCVPKLAYYGMPDHEARLARLEEGSLFGVKRHGFLLSALIRNVKQMEEYHLALMMDCDVVTNLSAAHADYYTRNGHSRSLYVQNMWPEPPMIPLTSCAQLAAGAKPKIFGSLGRLASTGNTFGLKYIAEQIVPRLDAALGPDGYEVHIFGEGEPVPTVRGPLNVASIKMRGWVEDIDSEIVSSHVFLVANNTGRYKGSHTRFLHAWSLRACCVGHSYNATANPQMVHMENVLLGETPEEMVALILRTIHEPELRESIGRGGWQVYQTHFTPRAVAGRLLDEMRCLVA